MSHGMKLSRTCDNKVVWDDHIIENDFKTVILGVPISNSNIVVRINDFERQKDQQTEILLREDLSSQVTGSTRIFFVKNGPIYNGLKIGKLASRPEDVTVRIKVVDEDVSKQFTGIEDFFFTQGKPLMRSNNYDFNSFVDKTCIEVKINGTLLADFEITDIDSKSGRIQLRNIPQISDTITITYYFQARVKELNSIQSRITLKELPKIGQEVKVAYYSKQNDGWYMKRTERALITNAQDIVFYRNKNSSRFFIEKENVSNQFTGIEKQFYVSHPPILPIFQVFKTTVEDALNNAVVVYINGERVPVAGINSVTGKVILYQIPFKTDLVEVTYYYETELEPDRISVDYYVDSTYCDKCSKYSDLLEYSIDKLGKYIRVSNEDKLIQDIKKFIRTILGSDPVAKWYGTSFEAIIGTKMFPDITKTKIMNELVTGLSKFKSAQIQQEQYQTVSDYEFLDVVSDVNVQQSVTQPGLFTISFKVTSQSGRIVTIGETVQIKG